jgi:hypothetical protein
LYPIKEFKLDAFVTVINELLRSDETERALWVCENLPGYYRDNLPLEIATLKTEILQRMSTPFKYAYETIHADMINANDDFIRTTLRWKMIEEEVKQLNAQQLIPHIIDMGPGHYWMPILLKRDGYKFTYFPMGLSMAAHANAQKWLGDEIKALHDDRQPTIFCALEVIEHLDYPKEILSNMLYMCGYADIVHLSTPKYTFGYELMNWRELGELQHRRTYTPREFADEVRKIFGDVYSQAVYASQIMHARLVNTASKYKILQKLDIKPSEVK